MRQGEPEAKGFWSDLEPIKAKTAGEYVTETIPRSAKRLAVGMVTLPYETGKTAIQGYEESAKQQQAASTELHTLLDKKTPLTPREQARVRELMDQSLGIPVVKGFERRV